MSTQRDATLLEDVAAFYSSKLAEHGPTPRGVDWKDAASQALRFEQLCRIIHLAPVFSVNDLGCGYGAFYEFLARAYPSFSYAGIDISADMIRAAEQRRHDRGGEARFLLGDRPDTTADYGIASGIFNVRMERLDVEWWRYLEDTLDMLDRTSRVGFAFNCLTSYADADKMRDDLYYADPCALFDLCKRRYSRDVALLHDYGLYEFTILVRKRP